MIPCEGVQLRHKSGGFLDRIGPADQVESWVIRDDQLRGGYLAPADAQRLLEDTRFPIARDEFEIVPGLACGCCGRWASYGGYPGSSEFRQVSPDHWRCDKHVGRLPCAIEGCGRTFSMTADDTYDFVVVCGKHWREAPLRMRRHVAAIRKKARRYGWTDRLLRLHNLAWHRALRSIQHGRSLDMTEINRMFGWDDSD